MWLTLAPFAVTTQFSCDSESATHSRSQWPLRLLAPISRQLRWLRRWCRLYCYWKAVKLCAVERTVIWCYLLLFSTNHIIWTLFLTVYIYIYTHKLISVTSLSSRNNYIIMIWLVNYLINWQQFKNSSYPSSSGKTCVNHHIIIWKWPMKHSSEFLSWKVMLILANTLISNIKVCNTTIVWLI